MKHSHASGETIVLAGQADNDGDGCSDLTELSLPAASGGDRDPDEFWDFFDVTGDRAIDVNDAVSVVQFFGDRAVDPSANLRDRSVSDLNHAWRTAEANDGIDVVDVINNLQSFGHACSN